MTKILKSGDCELSQYDTYPDNVTKVDRVNDRETLHILYLGRGSFGPETVSEPQYNEINPETGQEETVYAEAESDSWANQAWYSLIEKIVGYPDNIIWQDYDNPKGNNTIAFLVFNCPEIVEKAEHHGLEILAFEEVKVEDCPTRFGDSAGTVSIVTDGKNLFIIEG